jgi:hypothetical protein
MVVKIYLYPLEKSQLYQNLEQEVGLAPWTLIKAHHARGALIYVDSSLDLVEVGEAVISDDKIKVESWMNEQKLMGFPDKLIQTQKEMLSLIAQPYVLVQEKD